MKKFKDDYEIKSLTLKGLYIKIESFILKIKRNNSTNLKQKSPFYNKCQHHNGNIKIKKQKKENEKDNNKICKNESLKNIATNEKIISQTKNYDQFENCTNIENKNNQIENKSLPNTEKGFGKEKENTYKEADEENNINETFSNDSENHTEETNSNTTNNKEFQLIDENMKTLFLNSPKLSKDNSFNLSNISEDKNLSEISSQESISVTDYELSFCHDGNDIRKSYIQKLVSKALYLPNNKPKTHNSLIIFDWDDTLLPTTFLASGGVFNENLICEEKNQKKLEKLAKSVEILLNMAILKGDVYIITNADLKWVEFSSKKIYPNVVNILNKIKIISARGEWEKNFPGDSRSWKIQAFLSLANELDVRLVTNIICLGDSMSEMEAGKILSKKFSEAFVKTIKFQTAPKTEELNKHLYAVINQFNFIYSSVKNFTIRVEKKKKLKHNN